MEKRGNAPAWLHSNTMSRQKRRSQGKGGRETEMDLFVLSCGATRTKQRCITRTAELSLVHIKQADQQHPEKKWSVSEAAKKSTGTYTHTWHLLTLRAVAKEPGSHVKNDVHAFTAQHWLLPFAVAAPTPNTHTGRFRGEGR